MLINLPILVGKSPTLKGIRGILAAKSIKKGEVIESCPIVLIPKREWSTINETVIGNYKYAWDKSHDCAVLGYCGLTNHSYEPNAKYRRDFKNLQMEYVALRDIIKGEEIFINYNGDPKSKKSLRAAYTDYKL